MSNETLYRQPSKINKHQISIKIESNYTLYIIRIRMRQASTTIMGKSIGFKKKNNNYIFSQLMQKDSVGLKLISRESVKK